MQKREIIPRKYRLTFALVALLFLLWGVANNMNDTLLAAFKRIMSMSDVQTSLVQVAFYGAYFCMAIPAALLIKKYSYKVGILVGLFTYALGTMLFYPAGQSGEYALFLVAIYVMATGCAILETTANPLILTMGPRRWGTRRLNIAQALNPLGAIMGIMLSRWLILGELHSANADARSNMSRAALEQMQHHEFAAITNTYMLIGAVLLAVFVSMALMKMPEYGNAEESAPGTLQRLWRNKRYRYGVGAQFFYVGAQTCVWSFTIRLTMQLTGCSEAPASNIFLYGILAFTVFRFIFTWLMKFYRPARLLAIAAMAAVICSLTVVAAATTAALTALIALSGCMSLMFPTIYGMALEGVNAADTKLGASGLIMAILGGAVITPVQALASDCSGNISLSFVVPASCFAIILIYTLTYGKTAK